VKVGWMQKMLTRVESCGVPLRQAAGFAPFSMIVRAGVVTVVKLVPNAPELLCRHFVNPVVVHWASDVQGVAGVVALPWKAPNPLPQKPQKTLVCAGELVKSTAVLVTVPVLSWKPMGSVPRQPPVMVPLHGWSRNGGGQSWLVGNSGATALSSGVQARPSFGPPLQRPVVGLQIGHGWMLGSATHVAPVHGAAAQG
jgi:hypothetical protein